MLFRSLVFTVIASTAFGDSVPNRVADALIPLLHHTSQYCNVCVVNDDSNVDIIHDFLRTFWTPDKSVACIHGSSAMIGNSVKARCHLYIIPVNNHQYGVTLSRLAAGSSWNLYAKFVFYMQFSQFSKQQNAENVKSYNIAVLYFGLPKAVLIHHLTKSGAVQVFHTLPFQKFLNFGLNIQDAVNMLTMPLRNIRKHPIKAASVYNYSKQKKDVSLRVSCIYLLDALAGHLNGTAEWVHTAYDDFRSGVQLMFYDRKINIFFMADMRAEWTTSVSVPVITSDCLMVPERKIESFFKLMYVPFSYPVWITLVTIGVVCCLMSRLFRKQFPRNIMLQILFGASVADYQMESLERFTSFAFSTLLFFFSESYLALMITFMLENEYYPHLKTLGEFLQSDFNIIASPVVRRFLQENYPQYIAKAVEQPSLHGGSTNSDAAVIIFRNVGEAFVNSKSNINPRTNALKY